MRKLLLVMLVPFMVLGIMGCGTAVLDGAQNPVVLQGVWADASTDIAFVVSGNQSTVFRGYSGSYDSYGNIAFRTEYSGDEVGVLDNGAEFTIEFFWFVEPYEAIGTITCVYGTNGTNPAADTITVTDRVYENYYQNVMIPPVGLYNRK